MILLLDRECDICHKTQHSYFNKTITNKKIIYECQSCIDTKPLTHISLLERKGQDFRNAARAVLFEDYHKLQWTVGCDTEFFRNHIKNLWQPKMTWDNYGLWEIDHIISLSKFDLLNIKNWVIVNNWKNLQPLWIEQNRAKGVK